MFLLTLGILGPDVQPQSPAPIYSPRTLFEPPHSLVDVTWCTGVLKRAIKLGLKSLAPVLCSSFLHRQHPCCPQTFTTWPHLLPVFHVVRLCAKCSMSIVALKPYSALAQLGMTTFILQVGKLRHRKIPELMSDSRDLNSGLYGLLSSSPLRVEGNL